MSVDRHSRDRYAEILRHFAAGRLTNFEYEDACECFLRTPDRAVREIWWAMWHLYDDLKEHRMTGTHELPSTTRAIVVRSVVFLHSDLVFEWPRMGPLRFVLYVITLGRLGRPARPTGSDWELWPFFRPEDLAGCVARPRLLGGAC